MICAPDLCNYRQKVLLSIVDINKVNNESRLKNKSYQPRVATAIEKQIWREKDTGLQQYWQKLGKLLNETK